MNVIPIIEVLSALATIGAVVFSAGRFIESVKANTRATDKLSQIIDSHLTWSAQIVREHDERFAEHDTRLTVLEAKRR